MCQLINKPQQSKVAAVAFCHLGIHSRLISSPPYLYYDLYAFATAIAQAIEETKLLQSSQKQQRLFIFNKESITKEKKEV